MSTYDEVDEMDDETINELVEIGKGIIGAIKEIAHGDVSGPAGLEALAMAVAGESFKFPLSTAISEAGIEIRGGLSEIAKSINNLADAIRESKSIES